MTARCFSWDWRGQPNMDAIAEYVKELTSGLVVMKPVDTGSDDYAWVIADHDFTDEESLRLYTS